jgi:hypothetical protein
MKHSNKLPASVLTTAAVQGIRRRILAGEQLAQHELLALLSSHEQCRACCLVARHKLLITEREREDLMLAVRRETSKNSSRSR